MRREDLTVSAEQQMLVVRGERQFRTTETGCDYLVMERLYVEFRKEIPLPLQLDIGATDARLADGILEIRIPCSKESSEPREHRVDVR